VPFLPEKEVESDIIRAAGGLVWVLDEGEKKIVIVHRISARAFGGGGLKFNAAATDMCCMLVKRVSSEVHT
jgi:hypothetical protein